MILIVSHEAILNSVKNLEADQIEYGEDISFPRANLQAISGSSNQTALGIEALGMNVLLLDRIPDAQIAKFTLESRVRVKPIGGEYRSFFVKSKPIIHESEPELAYIEIILKEDYLVE